MKLMRYSGKHEAAMLARLGVLVGKGLVADLRAGYARYLVQKGGNPKGQQIADIYFPSYVAQFLYTGEAAWLALAEAHAYLAELAEAWPDATGLSDQDLFVPLEDCRLYAPLRPSKLICVGDVEAGDGGQQADPREQMPSAFVKAMSAITGPERRIMKPAACRDLVCEAELGIVIGKKCKRVSESDAYGVIAGYTIVNDVCSCDDRERNAGHLLHGRTYDTFAPMGPWVVTRGGIPDAMNLRVCTRVNGEERYAGNTRDLLCSVPKLIAHLSQITLMPGDVIAAGSLPGASTVPLAPGDVVECEIEGIGVLRNSVVELEDDSLDFSE